LSYLDITISTRDPDLHDRITAAWSTEGHSVVDIPADLYWSVAGASDVAAAYSSALANGVERPGADPAVITDQMILSHVQAFTPPA
jgi:hypothetical protein